MFCEFFSNLFTAILAGIFFKLIEILKKLRELIAVLTALANEWRFNTQHRGNKQAPFQTCWLVKTLSLLEFYEYCGPLSQKGLELFELMNDANVEQLSRRGLVPADVQERTQNALVELDKILLKLKGLVSWSSFLTLKFIWQKID